jgi:hypothetical protein
MDRNSLKTSLEDRYKKGGFGTFQEYTAPKEVDYLDNTFAVGFKKKAKPTISYHTGNESIFRKGLNTVEKYFPDGSKRI